MQRERNFQFTLKGIEMTKTFRTAVLAAVVATVAAIGFAAPSQANVVVGGHLLTRLSPSPLPYPGPGRVPSQCLPFAMNGHPVMFCDPGTNGAGVLPTPLDKTVDLIYAGNKPLIFKTPDFCILRNMPGVQAPGTRAMFCQHAGW